MGQRQDSKKQGLKKIGIDFDGKIEKPPKPVALLHPLKPF